MCHYKTWRDLVWKISPADWMCALYSTRAWLSVFMGVCFCANLCVLLLPSRMRGCGTNPCNLSDWHTPSGWELVTMPDGNEISDPPILFWFYFCPTSLKSLTDFHTDWLPTHAEDEFLVEDSIIWKVKFYRVPTSLAFTTPFSNTASWVT